MYTTAKIHAGNTEDAVFALPFPRRMSLAPCVESSETIYSADNVMLCMSSPIVEDQYRLSELIYRGAVCILVRFWEWNSWLGCLMLLKLY